MSTHLHIPAYPRRARAFTSDIHPLSFSSSSTSIYSLPLPLPLPLPDLPNPISGNSPPPSIKISSPHFANPSPVRENRTCVLSPQLQFSIQGSSLPSRNNTIHVKPLDLTVAQTQTQHLTYSPETPHHNGQSIRSTRPTHGLPRPRR